MQYLVIILWNWGEQWLLFTEINKFLVYTCTHKVISTTDKKETGINRCNSQKLILRSLINISLYIYNMGQIRASSSNCILQCNRKYNACILFTLIRFWTAWPVHSQEIHVKQCWAKNQRICQGKWEEAKFKGTPRILQTAKVGRKGQVSHSPKPKMANFTSYQKTNSVLIVSLWNQHLIIFKDIS